MKYKKAYPVDKKKFIYREHLDIMEWGSKEARESAGITKTNTKSFECEIMDWADVVAYAVHDLEDGLRAGYIDAQTFYSYRIDHADSIKEVAQKFKLSESVVEGHYQRLIRWLEKNSSLFKKRGAIGSFYANKASRKSLTSSLISRYIRAAKRIRRGHSFA